MSPDEKWVLMASNQRQVTYRDAILPSKETNRAMFIAVTFCLIGTYKGLTSSRSFRRGIIDNDFFFFERGEKRKIVFSVPSRVSRNAPKISNKRPNNAFGAGYFQDGESCYIFYLALKVHWSPKGLG